ncbi:MAG TPA: putative DNA-binding domain-containing protein [Thiobacillaceae bacterium]|nr:putative DNA-binding domain-containing protein [Thiobacillaceae bacterium]HNF90111.1 putative DNA-binding domain-containing protein [Thiobacillaceae bacterium]HNH90561.1 putative DNA-binding domain-containing protein [Thiobacillaceae bacterium]HNI08533.1 putative DNA-binding domain-containing protein [Thiobacillaceae bacterium]
MEFQEYQRAFTAHIRDPRSSARPKGVPARRMQVYNELLYNNLEGFLLACFPVCRNILGKRRWDRLVRAFFRDHTCHTPYFRQIPEEFLKYLQEEWQPEDGYPAFLPELAHYEWVELELDTSNRDADLPAHDPAGDLLAGRPLLNPVLRVLAYRWPVHRLSPRYKPAEPPPEPTFTLAFRDSVHQVCFTLINSATARLLTLLQENSGLTGTHALTRLERELSLPEGALREHGASLLADLRGQGVLLGTLA